MKDCENCYYKQYYDEKKNPKYYCLICVDAYLEANTNVVQAVKEALSECIERRALKLTHEATLFKSFTCPRCKNVIRDVANKEEEFDCPYCGQRLKK